LENVVYLPYPQDVSITIHFGGEPRADNFLRILRGWNYFGRHYQPKKEIWMAAGNFLFLSLLNELS
jgi:hypothetical protein